MTSLGALTTAFTAPASCAASTGIHIVGCGDACIWWAEGPLNADDCYPPNYNPSLGNYYTPGVCPSGYTPGCTSRRTAGQVTETVQTCCPTALGYKYRCVEPTWPWQNSLGCTVYMNEATYSFPTVTLIRDGRTVVTSTARTEVGIGAYGVEIRFQATDFGSSSSDTTTSGSLSTPTDSTATESTPTTSETNAASSPASTTDSPNTGDDTSASTSGSGLSTGAAAGVGVGATLGALALVGLGIFFGRRSAQQRRQQAAETTVDSNHLPPGDKFVAGGGGWYPLQEQQAVHELPVVERAELQGPAVSYELRG